MFKLAANVRNVVLIAIAYLGFLAITASMGVYFNIGALHKAAHKHVDAAQGVFALPGMTVNLVASGTQTGKIRLGLDLDVASKDMDQLTQYVPRIIDRIQSYMQNIMINEIRGTMTLNWLKDDLLWEINLVSGPVHILGLAFRELVVM